MQQNESLQVMFALKSNGLLDRKSLHTQSRHRVAHAMRREHYIGPLIAVVIRIHLSHSHYAQAES